MAWFTKFVKHNVKNPKKIAKALVKYGGRAILRRTNIFGVYGSIKKYRRLFKSGKYTKWQAFRKTARSVVKKNFLRALGPANYIRDAFKRGMKYTLKKFAWNKFVPMSVKKIIYLHQNYEKIFGNKTILKQSKKEIWKKLGYGNHKNTYMWKLNQIEAILNTKMEDNKGERQKNFLLDKDFVFRVKSPQSHNFSQTFCYWNPITKEFKGWIRGWPKHWGPNEHGTRLGGPYKAILEIKIIKEMVSTSNYGKYFNRHWKYNNKNRYVRIK